MPPATTLTVGRSTVNPRVAPLTIAAMNAGTNHDAVRTMARKPYPAIEGMRNVQRLLKTQNPRIGDVNVEDLVDNRFVRRLDESGFFERFYGK